MFKRKAVRHPNVAAHLYPADPKVIPDTEMTLLALKVLVPIVLVFISAIMIDVYHLGHFALEWMASGTLPPVTHTTSAALSEFFIPSAHAGL